MVGAPPAPNRPGAFGASAGFDPNRPPPPAAGAGAVAPPPNKLAYGYAVDAAVFVVSPPCPNIDGLA